MSEEYTIERRDAPGHGRYHIALPGGLEAEMTYRKVGDDTIVIDHTYTPPEFRGHHIAFLLLSRGIADARAEGKKVVPECSYAEVQFRRHKEWDDLLAV
jgi:predicted GNAT family acetyltransferase